MSLWEEGRSYNLPLSPWTTPAMLRLVCLLWPSGNRTWTYHEPHTLLTAPLIRRSARE